MKTKIRNRQFNAEFRAVEDTENNKKTIIGRPVVYDKKANLGYFEEIIERGALNGADLSDVFLFVNHDISKIPLARSKKDSESTMRIKIDNEGLSIEADLDIENNSDAKNLYSAIKRGDITGMSFMFSVGDEEWENIDSDFPTRRIKKISSIAEVSAVCFPIYSETEINARDRTDLENARKKVINKKEEEKRNSINKDLELEKLKIKFLYGGNI
ncbi:MULTISPECIES: HK97 family phage prohead protease [unclassified Clostridioides]|uniref:HK97 family phage prohead protease n=1 Tax=unclassified Clostridioides TaxID=2635829 RepID=UPI001D10F2D6|nr:HK97 family phage prohead protease [Clostridioides sp. ES-S-0001-02]MCC0670819.1 HK97 family phage prohead protease [Clostridioides sp. ES-S-0145-01]UDN56763.1 HK97 family phage prohead protease [Clostridioides sp. ES-S-0010-02]